jgi:5-methylcytosine-specific restriction enzyme A
VPWDNSREKRARDARTYGPEYKRNRAAARRRANGHCEICGHRHQRLECDHIVNVAAGGTHHLDNLRMACKGPGTCRCHETKTAGEGGGYRWRGRTGEGDPPFRPRTVW